MSTTRLLHGEQETNVDEEDYLLSSPRRPLSRAPRETLFRAVYGTVDHSSATSGTSTSAAQQSARRRREERLPGSKDFPTKRARYGLIFMMMLYKLASTAGTVHTQYFHARFSEGGTTNATSNSSLFLSDDSLLGAVPATTCSQVQSGINATNSSVQKDENEVQKQQSQFQMYLSYAGLAPTVIGCMILGSSSDVMGRKVLILIPLVVAWLSQVFYLFFMWFDLDMTYTYVVGVICAIPGGGFTMTMGTNAYTADLTPPEKTRTMAFLLLEYIPALMSLFSTLLIGYLIDHYGFFKAALLPNAFLLVCIGIVIWLPETVPIASRRGCARLGNPLKYAKNVFSFYLTSGTPRERCQFRLALFILLFHYTCSLGYGSVFGLYEMGLPFCWNAEKIAQYGAVSTAMHTLPHLLLVYLMQRFFSDSFIMAYALIPAIVAHVLTGLAHHSVMLYIVLVIGIMEPPSTTINKAILSSMADADKQGAMFASIVILEVLCDLISKTVYYSIYHATVSTMRGFVFLFSAGLYVINFFLVLVFVRTWDGGKVYEKTIVSPNIQSEDAENEQNSRQ